MHSPFAPLDEGLIIYFSSAFFLKKNSWQASDLGQFVFIIVILLVLIQAILGFTPLFFLLECSLLGGALWWHYRAGLKSVLGPVFCFITYRIIVAQLFTHFAISP
jgi:hypothetical protein